MKRQQGKCGNCQEYKNLISCYDAVGWVEPLYFCSDKCHKMYINYMIGD